MILHEFPSRYATLRTALQERYEAGEANEIAKRLLEHVTGTSWKEWQLHPDKEWNPDWTADLENGHRQLLAGIPVQHVFGYSEFYGRKFQVSRDVLIPRMETEELVHWILADESDQSHISFLDIGTGSGCIALSLAAEWWDRQISFTGNAMDVSEAALAVAKSNAERLSTPMKWHLISIFEATPTMFEKLDLIVSNPPYVTLEEKVQMSDLVLDHDPELALFAPEEDALAFYRAIAERAMDWLKPEGRLYFEINEAFGPETVQLLKEMGFSNIELRKDLNEKDRMVRAYFLG